VNSHCHGLPHQKRASERALLPGQRFVLCFDRAEIDDGLSLNEFGFADDEVATLTLIRINSAPVLPPELKEG
jgi:hypothetical protein